MYARHRGVKYSPGAVLKHSYQLGLHRRLRCFCRVNLYSLGFPKKLAFTSKRAGSGRHRATGCLASLKVRPVTSDSGHLSIRQVEQFGCVRSFVSLRVGVFPLTTSNPCASRAAQLSRRVKVQEVLVQQVSSTTISPCGVLGEPARM